MSKKGEAISSKDISQSTTKKKASEETSVEAELGVITAVETDEEKEVRENTRKKETPESSKSKVVETDEEREVEKPSTSSSSRRSLSSLSRLKVLLSKSPRKEKSETTKPKKAAKMKKVAKGQEKSKGVAKEQVLANKDSLSTSKDEGPAKRSMVQTNLSNTKEGMIEVISSPEQPQLKSQRKKSDKKSRSALQVPEKQSKDKKKLQTQITNLFPVRKSSRKCKTEQEKDENANITRAILSKEDEGLEVRNIEGKGRGIFTTRPFNKNEFICEYAGERISYKEAKKREKKYEDDKDIGCYMYYLEYNNTKYCIDATEENGTFGRLLNHSRSGNCKTKLHIIKNKPHLVLVAKIDVESGEELTYDYGERNKGAIESHPWLKS